MYFYDFTAKSTLRSGLIETAVNNHQPGIMKFLLVDFGSLVLGFDSLQDYISWIIFWTHGHESTRAGTCITSAIEFCIQEHDTDESLKSLLRIEAAFTKRPIGCSELQLAVASGNRSLTSRLLAANAEPNNPALYAASALGHEHIVSELLAAGADGNSTANDSGFTALDAAVEGEHEEVIYLLFKAGADSHLMKPTNRMKSSTNAFLIFYLEKSLADDKAEKRNGTVSEIPEYAHRREPHETG